MPTIAYQRGLHELGDGLFTYLQPDGGWGWSNAGLITAGGTSLLIDTLFDLNLTQAMLDAMSPITRQHPIGQAFNTHGNGDHWYGNQLLPDNIPIVASARAIEDMRAAPPAAVHVLFNELDLGPEFDAFAKRNMRRFDFAAVSERLPTQSFQEQHTLMVGDRQIHLIELGPAHTHGDSIAHVPDADTVFTGDLLFIEGTPLMWAGPIENWLTACARILELNATTIVPGHGPVTDNAGIHDVQRYLTYVKDEARKRFDAGMDDDAAADDIDISDFRDWGDPERLAANVANLYREFDPSLRALPARAVREDGALERAPLAILEDRRNVMATGAVQASNRTIARAAANAADRFADRMAVRYHHGDEWRDKTFAEVSEIVDEIALGLLGLGVEPGHRVCLLANTRAEWTYSSLAISRAGAVVVPIYPTNSPDECEWVIGNSDARIVIAEDAEQAAKVEEVRDRLEQLEHMVLIDPGDETAADANATTLERLRERDRGGDRSELERRCQAVTPEDPYTIIYTSGTTGRPKGVVLSHGNCASVGMMVEEIGFITEDELSYLYLPLAHSFALTVQLASFDVGTAIIYFGGDTQQIIAELQQVKPTYVPSVPRIFEKIYALALAMADDEQRLRDAVGLGVKVRQMRLRGEPVPEDLTAAFDRADEALYGKVRQLFGGRIDKCVSGAAPIAKEILEFFYACGVTVLEGWGMTETTAVGAVNLPDRLRFGTVGRAMPGVELQIAEDGEILIKGPNVFREYWRNPEATKDTFTEDGWLLTGDLGSLDDDGYLSITGRKKDIIITAGGKNLTPANLENDLKQSRWISHAVMYGDRRPYPVALITLDPETIIPWAKEQGLPEDMAALVQTNEVRELIQQDMDRANTKYARVEQVKKFALLDHDLTQEGGELTPTLKLKRGVVNDRYQNVFESLYSN